MKTRIVKGFALPDRPYNSTERVAIMMSAAHMGLDDGLGIYDWAEIFRVNYRTIYRDRALITGAQSTLLLHNMPKGGAR